MLIMFIYNMLSESFINDNAILSMAKHHKRRRRMRGGMANFDKDNKLVEQVEDESPEAENEYELKNIPFKDYLNNTMNEIKTLYNSLEDQTEEEEKNKIKQELKQKSKELISRINEVDELLVQTERQEKTLKNKLSTVEPKTEETQ